MLRNPAVIQSKLSEPPQPSMPSIPEIDNETEEDARLSREMQEVLHDAQDNVQNNRPRIG